MEKIYTQGQGQKSRQQKQMNISVILSFTLAILSIFTIGTFAIVNNQGGVSYAAPTGDTFKMIIPDVDQAIMQVQGIGEGGERFNVPLYYADSVNANNRVFCVEMRKVGGDGATYTKADLTDDPGLIYILNNSFANGVRITGYNGTYSDEIEVWATQSAIWLYLAEKYPDVQVNKFYATGEKKDASDNSIGTKNALETASSFQMYGGGVENSGAKVDITGIPAKVRTLVNTAKNQTSSETLTKLTVSPANNNMSQTPDKKFYQTALITVTGTPANAFKTYNLNLSGVDGVKVVDENGADMALTNIAAGKKFYLRIPANQVTEATKTLKVSVTANFTVKTGVYYTSGDIQKVVALTDTTKEVISGTEFEIAGSPNTGMNAAQTIYFIGLIVLLCGVGIVYANAKPVESKQ